MKIQDKYFNLLTAVCISVLITFSYCNPPEEPTEEEVKKFPEESIDETWDLIFLDEFDGDTYDEEFWESYQTQPWSVPWNVYVVPDDKELAEVRDGHLYLRARWNEKTDLPETGAIQTKDKFSFKYGKLEVRAKFTRSGQGGWSAIWLMPQTPVYTGWPQSGEIDVMERLNVEPRVHQVIHQSESDGVKLNPAPATVVQIDPHEYNTYGMVKSENKIELYVNGIKTLTHIRGGKNANKWPFETDFYIILNYACADKGQSGFNFWPGLVNSTADFPYEMAVDWVKVWEKVEP